TFVVSDTRRSADRLAPLDARRPRRDRRCGDGTPESSSTERRDAFIRAVPHIATAWSESAFVAESDGHYRVAGRTARGVRRGKGRNESDLDAIAQRPRRTAGR